MKQSKKQSKKQIIPKFNKNERGNFAILFALVATPVILASSLMVDYSNITRTKSQIMFAADAAIMAAASNAGRTVNLKALSKDLDIAKLSKTIGEDFDNFFIANLSDDLQQYVINTKTAYDNVEHKFKATIDFRYDVALISRAMPEGFKFSAFTEVNIDIEEQESLSLMLVLDDSASMGLFGRKEALQSATLAMMDDMDASDPTNNYIRTGVVSYARRHRAGTYLSWNEQLVKNFVNTRLIAFGGTQAHESVARATKLLGDGSSRSREYLNHMDRSGQAPRRAMVVMSDGVVYGTNAFYVSCEKAKSDGILIYTVAFDSPEKGSRILRQCASGSSFHYDAENASELTDVFKQISKHAMGNARFSS